MAYKTGLCDIGACEGTKPVAPSGKAMKTCTAIDICKCKCHADIAAMYEAVGKPRVVKHNPDYVPYVVDFWLPSMQQDDEQNPLEASPLPVGASTDVAVKRIAPPAPAPVRGIAEGTRAFAPTPTGRRAKGLLEDEVRHVCNSFMKREIEGPLTPKLIANLIDEAEPPSVGAVDSVLKRWEKLGFAELDVKPSRFVTYTVDGMKLGLEKMKDNAKRQAKLQKGAQKRGVRT